ncbi:MAG: molybdopterin molybdotransferase MoeA [Defluviitaleaceae bacterium]|nr:molybdopterin molybdotransferase MoeA [Defluviitaleaceae bacterium]
MDFLKVDTLDTAIDKMKNAAEKWLYKHENIPLFLAHGRILSQDIFAPQNLPAFRRSAVDGYAVQAKDVAGAGESSPAFLQVAGAVLIGQPTNLHVQGGQCVEVPTGGMVPAGADAVVMIEYVENFGENGIAVYSPVAAFDNMVEIGDDMQADTLLLTRGSVLSPKNIGALAAIGMTKVPVYGRSKVTIISTGDELVALGDDVPHGKIRDISSYSLQAMAAQGGLQVVDAAVLPDDINVLEAALRQGMASSDMVIISGGSSYGKYDMTAKAITNVASPGVFTHGLALKPGKPTILAADDLSQTLIVGLPGHPVSAMVVFELLMKGMRHRLLGCRPAPPISARLTSNVPADGGKMTVYPCTLAWDGSAYIATPVFGKSATITTLTKADGYFTIDAGVEGLPQGADVLVHLL